MNWKTRQLFSDREHGIVSGLSPVNMVNGGSVPIPAGYEDGGTVPTSMPFQEAYNLMQALAKDPTMPVSDADKAQMERAFFLGGEDHTFFRLVKGMNYQPSSQFKNIVSKSLPKMQDGTSKEEAQAMQVISERDKFIEDTVPPALRKIGKASNAMLGPVASMLEKILGDTEEPSIEQQVAALAAQQGISVPAARATILKQMIQEKGLTLSNEIINQFATGLITLQDALAQAVGPPKMQTGGLALDLFEEGDQEINEPLNIMAQAVSPSIADITPTEKVEETVTVTEDQGPTDVSALKEAFQQLAIQAVDAAKDAIAQGAPVEQVQGPLQERLMMIDEQYRQKSGTQDTILTEEFLAQLGSLTDISAEVVSMQDGGEVPLREVSELDMALVDLKRAKDALAAHKAKRRGGGHAGMSRYDARTKILEAAVQTAQEKVDLLLSSAENVTGTPTDGPAADVEAKAKADAIAKAKADAEARAKAKADAEARAKANKEEKKDIIPALTTQGFWEEMKANANRAKLGTMMSGKSKQGGIQGTMDVLGQAEVAGAEALGEAQAAMLSQLGASERTAATLGKPTSLTKEERDLKLGSILLLSQMFADMVKNADGDIFEAMESFSIAGYEIPDNLKGILTGTITGPAGPVTFQEFYKIEEAKGTKWQDIVAKWQTVVANEPK